jgi:hypothetical protein
MVAGSVGELTVFGTRSWLRTSIAVQFHTVRSNGVIDDALGCICCCVHPPPARTSINLASNAIAFQFRRRRPVGLCRKRLADDACRLVDQIGLACGTRESQIGLLELTCEELQRDRVCALHCFGHRMHNRFGSMILAPDGCHHGARFSVQSHRRHRVPSRGFDRCEIETKGVSVVVRTPNVEVCVAL